MEDCPKTTRCTLPVWRAAHRVMKNAETNEQAEIIDFNTVAQNRGD